MALCLRGGHPPTRCPWLPGLASLEAGGSTGPLPPTGAILKLHPPGLACPEPLWAPSREPAGGRRLCPFLCVYVPARFLPTVRALPVSPPCSVKGWGVQTQGSAWQAGLQGGQDVRQAGRGCWTWCLPGLGALCSFSEGAPDSRIVFWCRIGGGPGRRWRLAEWAVLLSVWVTRQGRGALSSYKQELGPKGFLSVSDGKELGSPRRALGRARQGVGEVLQVHLPTQPPCWEWASGGFYFTENCGEE